MSETQQSPRASEFMTADVKRVTEEMSLTDVVQFLLKHQVSTAPVVEMQNGKPMLLGFISEGDCLSALTNELFFGNPSPAQTARTVMTSHPICVAPETELFSLVSVFTSHHLRHLPVVENGVLLGLVSRRDILKAMELYYKRQVHDQDRERLLKDTSQSLNLRFMIDRG
ncbi:MAG: CBS domain-containing protein [Planctomycetaceae bacterium]|nr:CBS domain-containing protein [Planctomycetaceae bacterium]